MGVAGGDIVAWTDDPATNEHGRVLDAAHPGHLSDLPCTAMMSVSLRATLSPAATITRQTAPAATGPSAGAP